MKTGTMASPPIARWAVEPLPRDRRGLDERLVLAAPWLLRLLLPLIERVRPQSRFRRAVLGHLPRVGIAAVNRDDYELILAVVSPEVEIHYYPDAPGQRPPDVEPIYRGPERYLEALKSAKSAFAAPRYELTEFFDAGGDRIGARSTLVASGASSGIALDMRQFLVWQFDRGSLRRQWVLHSERAMLERLSQQTSA